MQIAAIAFRLVDPTLVLRVLVPDGCIFAKGEAASILSAKRVALSFAGRMCGVATQTSAFLAETHGTRIRITRTRKTTSGLRMVEKQAVLHGGCFNHGFCCSMPS